MSNTKDKKLPDLLKTVEARIAGISGLIVALMGGYAKATDNPRLFGYTIAAVIGILSWLKLFDIYRAKRQIANFPEKVFDYRHSKRKRAAALVGLFVLPLVASGVILALVLEQQNHNKPLQHALQVFRPRVVLRCPPVTVTIAGFKPASAEEIRLNFWAELQNRFNRQNHQDIKLTSLSRAIINKEESEWENDAMQLGQSEEGQSHLIVYGALLTAAPLTMQVYVSRVNSCDNKSSTMANESLIQPIESRTLIFRRDGQDTTEISNQLADIAIFIAGLAFYEQHEFNEALRVLGQSTTPEARLYEGLIYYERGRQRDSIVDLKHALRKFQGIVNDRSNPEPGPEIKAHANANAGNAFLLLSQVDFQQAENHIRNASDSYAKALRYYDETLGLPEEDLTRLGIEKNIRRAWGTTTTNLAVAKIWQAKRQGPQQMKEPFAFGHAERDLQQVREQCPKSGYPSEWISATINLATFWAFEQSPMEQDQKTKLQSAEKEFEEVLSLIEQDRSSFNRPQVQYRWAGIQANLGAVYSNEALGTEIQLGKAEECYQKASTIFTRTRSLLTWAQNEDDWGLVLTKQGRLAEDKKQAVEFLDKAIDKFNRADEVYRNQGSIRDQALVKSSLADAIREKGKRNSDQALLSEAVGLSERAVTMMKSAPGSCSALDLAKAQQILGDSYYEMGRLGGTNKTMQLNEAKNAYDAALGIWKSFDYYDNQRKVNERLVNVQNALTSEPRA